MNTLSSRSGNAEFPARREGGFDRWARPRLWRPGALHVGRGAGPAGEPTQRRHRGGKEPPTSPGGLVPLQELPTLQVRGQQWPAPGTARRGAARRRPPCYLRCAAPARKLRIGGTYDD